MSGAERTGAEAQPAERALRAELERLRRDLAALRQRLERAEAAEERAHERLGDELGRLGDALDPVETWRSDVDRDLGRLTAELAQRAAAIDDANAAIDDLRASDRVAELAKLAETLRVEQAELLAGGDERELRIDAAEGRMAALEAAAEAFSERLHGLEAAAQATTEETRRLREASDRREHDERVGALERRVDALVAGAARRTPDPLAHAGPLTRGGTERLRAALRGRGAPWPPRPWLPGALRALAASEPETVLRTLGALLPVSDLVAGEPLAFAVAVAGQGDLAAGPEGAALRFRVRTDALGLAELLDGARPARGPRADRGRPAPGPPAPGRARRGHPQPRRPRPRRRMAGPRAAGPRRGHPRGHAPRRRGRPDGGAVAVRAGGGRAHGRDRGRGRGARDGAGRPPRRDRGHADAGLLPLALGRGPGRARRRPRQPRGGGPGGRLGGARDRVASRA